MSKEKIIYLPLGILTIATAVSGAVLASGGVDAAKLSDSLPGDDGVASVWANATVTVSPACTLSSTVTAEHVATMINGNYQSEIGTTRLLANCNDANGYAIYAIGYSNDTFGNTSMIGTSGDTFATGTATSGNDSAWAMKVSSVGSTGPVIQNGFGAYSAVPSSYMMVASQAGATDTTSGSAIDATYAVYVSGSQTAGTYTGQVKYSLVHPSTAVAPTE